MLRPHVRAALLAAAAFGEGDATPLMPRAELLAALDEAWSATAAAQLVNSGPLLCLAEVRLARAAHDASDTGTRESAASAIPDRLAAHRPALDAARSVLVATQQGALPADAPASLADGIGAYVLTGSAAGRASSQSTRAQVLVALLAGRSAAGSNAAPDPTRDPTRDPNSGAAAGAPALAPAGQDSPVATARDQQDRRSLRMATRFLAQLTADASIATIAPRPERALGGVLASPSDASQPLAAQAMAIWALAETERAEARLEAMHAPRGAAAAPAPPPAPALGGAAVPVVPRH